MGQQEDLTKGFHHLYKAENNLIFYLYAPKHQSQIYGILDDKITSYSSPLYDGGTVDVMQNTRLSTYLELRLHELLII